MKNDLRVRAVLREPIDIDKLAQALLRLARDRAALPAASRQPQPTGRPS